MGLFRGQGSQSHTRNAEAIEMGNHNIFPDARPAHAGGLHETRPRASRSRRRALCAVMGDAKIIENFKHEIQISKHASMIKIQKILNERHSDWVIWISGGEILSAL